MSNKLQSAGKLLVLFLCAFNFTYGQSSADEGYYYFPIRPGNINYLSGSMGEIRASHFHAGIDIKTGGVEGLPVYASADGYVSRIKVSTGGYGNALYIQHPNGATTVYAHLLKYNDEIAQYVRNAQYENESFEIELFPEKEEILVKRGQIIGLSGNSGSSGGPHLHYEIRDINQEVMNPLYYGFKEIKDDIPPSAFKIALIPLAMDSRINGKFERAEYKLYRRSDEYYINEPISAYGEIGVQILAYDMLNGASNRNGVVCMDLLVNGEEKFYYNISKFSFSETRNILAHYDYGRSRETGERFQKLYVDDGNFLSAYRTGKQGRLFIREKQEYDIAINLYDAYNNHSRVHFTLAGERSLKDANPVKPLTAGPEWNTFNEILVMEVPAKSRTESAPARVFANSIIYDQAPSITMNDRNVYLWHLKNGIPDSIETSAGIIRPEIDILVPSSSEFNFYHNWMDVYFPKYSLFDTLAFLIRKNIDGRREIFEIGDQKIPLRKHIYITLKPERKYGNKERTAVYGIDRRGRYSFYGGEWRGDNIRFSTRDFGTFTILADNDDPDITPVTVNKETLSFYISDKLSGVKSYELRVNGEWVLMNYDYKKNLIWSEKQVESQPFKGEVVLRVMDKAGNEKEYRLKL